MVDLSPSPKVTEYQLVSQCCGGCGCVNGWQLPDIPPVGPGRGVALRAGVPGTRPLPVPVAESCTEAASQLACPGDPGRLNKLTTQHLVMAGPGL